LGEQHLGPMALPYTKNMNEKKREAVFFSWLNFAIFRQRNWENFGKFYFSNVNFTKFSFWWLNFAKILRLKKIKEKKGNTGRREKERKRIILIVIKKENKHDNKERKKERKKEGRKEGRRTTSNVCVLIDEV
jgi:hypothetical protein